MPKTGAQGEEEVVINIGCTWCLISLSLCQMLGIQTKPLASPINFEQLNESLIGGAPATEPVQLEMCHHWELTRFIVAPKMTETVILGLARLDKWGPTISWEDGYRKIKMGLGPLPPPDPTSEAASAKKQLLPQNHIQEGPKSPENTVTCLKCLVRRNAMPYYFTAPQTMP